MKSSTTVYGLVAAQLLGAALVGSMPASAIVTRHDKDDQAFRSLGEQYPQAVSVLPDGSGALVAPSWVLTAAHVARGVSRRQPRVEVAGKEIPVTRIFLHPQWADMGAHDIALLKLAKPVREITPVALYDKDDEVGQIVTFVGRGDYGTGLTGPKTMDRVKRGATNRVDEADDDWLFFTFDRGEQATELEGVSGPGDSGGPALVQIDGKLFTLGVSVFADGDQGPGRYGVREGYTRVSTHREWVQRIIAGKTDEAGFVPGAVRTSSDRGSGQRRVVSGGMPGGGSTELPDNAAGRLVSTYFEVYNSDNDGAMRGYITDHFSKTLRERRSEAEHIALYRRLYDELFGTLKISRIENASDEGITVMCDAAKGSMAKFRFELQPGTEPADVKIDRISIARVDVSMR